MAFEPIAVSGGAAAKMPMDVDVSAQSHVTAGGGAQNTHTAVGSSQSIDLFNYSGQQLPRALPLDALSADGKARHYANPATLGEEVLNYLEGFHKRVGSDKDKALSDHLGSRQMAAATPVSTGPASMMPATTSSLPAVGSAGADPAGAAGERFEAVMKFMEEVGYRHTETNLVSNAGQQFSKAVNTLMRGQ